MMEEEALLRSTRIEKEKEQESQTILNFENPIKMELFY